MIFMLFNTFFFSCHHLLPALLTVCNQKKKKINEQRFCGKWVLSDSDFPRPTLESEADSTLSPLRAPPGHLTEFKETLAFVHFSFSISNLSVNELLLYLWMTHIKFSPINFEMDFEMGPKLLSNAWESHLDYCISLIT